jgi:alkylhydroperoxidase family enzyme
MTEHERVQEAAAELALGLLSGPERADALAHMDGCAACRTTVEELADVADHMLLLAPETEPPPGVETGVLARIDGKEHRRPSRRRAVVAAAAVVAFLLGGVTGALLFRDRQSRYDREYIAALRELDGRALAAARVRVPGGEQVGQLFLYEGTTSWLFVTINDPRPQDDAELGVELRFEDGRRVVIPGLHVVDGRGSLGTTAELRLRDLDGIGLVDADGRARYTVERLR